MAGEGRDEGVFGSKAGYLRTRLVSTLQLLARLESFYNISVQAKFQGAPSKHLPFLLQFLYPIV
jgi:hypothetical protein